MIIGFIMPGGQGLSDAVKRNNIGALELLLNSGAEVDTRGDNSWTPLHIAAGLNNIKIIELLLSRGANINAQDSFGCTPLHYAAHDGFAAAVNLLVASGADVNLKDNRDRTPEALAANEVVWTSLHWAVVIQDTVRIKQLLADDAIKVNAQDKYLQNTPLHYAALEGYAAVANLLLERGAVLMH
jgi:ankyrin repeat protein